MSAPPPHDLAAEQCTLGGMMLHRDAITDVTQIIGGGDYYRPAHQLIHEAIVALYGEGEPADAVTVAALLARRGQLARVGNGDYLHTLIASVPSWANAGYHARIVREHRIRRDLIEEASRIAQMAQSGEGDATELAERARAAMEAVTAGPMAGEPKTMGALLAEVLDALENDTARGLPTGLSSLDCLLGGMAPGELILVGARPSVGKSVLVKDIAVHLALRHGLPVLLSSLEMSAGEIMLRIISGRARVSLHHMTTHQVDERDWDMIAKVSGEIADTPLVIDDSPGTGLAGIRARLRTMARTAPAQALVVDYLGLLAPPRAENRQAEVAALSRGLKLLAREFAIPVIAAAQLNRESERRHDKRPTLADLRESGAQEQDADVVILLHREDYYEQDSPRAGEIDLIVAKNRQGPKATITAAFQGHYARVVDMAPEDGDWDPSSKHVRAA